MDLRRPAFSAALAAFGLLALVALPHCANGEGPKRGGFASDGDETGTFEEQSKSSSSSSEPSASEPAPAAPATPVDAGAVDASTVDAGCTESVQCEAVPCKCKIGVSFDARLCVAGTCGAPKDVCPNACALAGGWSGP